MAHKGFWVGDDVLEPETLKVVLKKAQRLDEAGCFKEAAIGKWAMKQTRQDIRNDQIAWIEDFSSEVGQVIDGLFSFVMDKAREGLYLPIKRFECHFAHYQTGQFYKRHKDRHNLKPGRELTCVLYLNDLGEGEGGELCLYTPQEDRVIIPKAGRLVIFKSELEHEVFRASQDRWSLTGWLRSDLHPELRLGMTES